MSFGSGGAVGEAWYNLTVKDEGVMAGLHEAEGAFAKSGQIAETSFDHASDAIEETGAHLTTAGQKTGLFGSAMSKVGDVGRSAFAGIQGAIMTSFGGAVANAPIMAMEKIGQAVELASDKAESASKANTIFGTSYKIVEEASKNAANVVNMSSGAYLAAAGDLGNLTTNLGFTGDEAANMSVDMLQLAADMGSFNNASPQEVVEAMGAAFRGETEPIRRFGVMLSETAVQEKAVTMGLVDSVGAFNDMDFATQTNIKAQATYALILDQTKNAQGDLAKTSDSLANSQARSAAQQEEAWTKIGEKLVPIIQEVLPHLTNAIILVVDTLGFMLDAIKGIVDFITPAIDALGKLAGGATDLISKGLKPVNDAIGKLIEGGLKPLTPIIIGVASAITIFMLPALLASGRAMLTQLATGAAEAGKALLTKLVPSLLSSAAAAGAEGLMGALSALVSPMGIAAVVTGLVVVASVKLYEAWQQAKADAVELVKTLPAMRDGMISVEEKAQATTDALGQIHDEYVELKDEIMNTPDDIRNGFGLVKGVQMLGLELSNFVVTTEAENEIARLAAESEKAHAAALGQVGADARDTTDHLGEYMDFLTSRAAPVVAAAAAEFEKVGDAIEEAVKMDPEEVAEDARESLIFAARAAEVETFEAFRAIGAGVPGQLGDAIYEHATEALSGLAHLRDVLKNGLTPEEIAMEAIGAKAVRDVGRGMISEIPGAKEDSIQVAVASIQAIQTAGLKGAKGEKGFEAVGKYFDNLLSGGMTARTALQLLRDAGVDVTDASMAGIRTKYPDLFTAGELAAGKVSDGFGGKDAKADANANGKTVADSFIAGIASFLRSEVAERRVHDAAAAATSGLGPGQSPPKTGPLHFIDKWGETVGKEWAGGVAKGVDAFALPFGLDGGSTSFDGEIRARVVHEIDLKNAPPGITNAGVAELVQKGTDATGLSFNLRHAATLRFREAV